MNYELLKIYKFENGEETIWIAIYEDNRSMSWTVGRDGNPHLKRKDNNKAINFIKDYPSMNPYSLMEKTFNKELIIECLDNKCEENVIWRADGQEIKSPQPIDITKDYSLDRFDLIINN